MGAFAPAPILFVDGRWVRYRQLWIGRHLNGPNEVEVEPYDGSRAMWRDVIIWRSYRRSARAVYRVTTQCTSPSS